MDLSKESIAEPVFADIHTHILFGVDDGPDDQETSRRMIDLAYAEGTRLICCTPHYHPGYFGKNSESAALAFAALQEYAADRYPDLRLFLANEVRYTPGAGSWVREGLCRCLADGVPLVDFLYDAEKNEILFAMRELLSSGYRPVLAHVERYTNLKKKDVAALRDSGVMMQVNSASLLPGAPQGRTARAEKLLSAGLVDFVSSDTHDPHHRPPMMKKSYERIKKRYGSAYADAIFYRNAVKLLVG